MNDWFRHQKRQTVPASHQTTQPGHLSLQRTETVALCQPPYKAHPLDDCKDLWALWDSPSICHVLLFARSWTWWWWIYSKASNTVTCISREERGFLSEITSAWFGSLQSLSRVWLFVTHRLQHTMLTCPSPTPGACSNSCPLSRWCHPNISSSVIPSPPAFNLSQHQGLSQWVSSSHQAAKVLEFQLQHQSFQWIFRTGFL